ncbi:hypothetical protein T492DRAFT_16139 [Pavlovales sp. CCMP2436]|nr:hypothetical protein T492DRAFT_16139 [Pavlovales sp. CCMP2436]
MFKPAIPHLPRGTGRIRARSLSHTLGGGARLRLRRRRVEEHLGGGAERSHVPQRDHRRTGRTHGAVARVQVGDQPKPVREREHAFEAEGRDFGDVTLSQASVANGPGREVDVDHVLDGHLAVQDVRRGGDQRWHVLRAPLLLRALTREGGG